MKAGEDGRVALKGYAEVLLRSSGSDANDEESEAGVGEFVGGAVMMVIDPAEVTVTGPMPWVGVPLSIFFRAFCPLAFSQMSAV